MEPTFDDLMKQFLDTAKRLSELLYRHPEALPPSSGRAVMHFNPISFEGQKVQEDDLHLSQVLNVLGARHIEMIQNGEILERMEPGPTVTILLGLEGPLVS